MHRVLAASEVAATQLIRDAAGSQLVVRQSAEAFLRRSRQKEVMQTHREDHPENMENKTLLRCVCTLLARRIFFLNYLNFFRQMYHLLPLEHPPTHLPSQHYVSPPTISPNSPSEPLTNQEPVSIATS